MVFCPLLRSGHLRTALARLQQASTRASSSCPAAGPRFPPSAPCPILGPWDPSDASIHTHTLASASLAVQLGARAQEMVCGESRGDPWALSAGIARASAMERIPAGFRGEEALRQRWPSNSGNLQGHDATGAGLGCNWGDRVLRGPKVLRPQESHGTFEGSRAPSVPLSAQSLALVGPGRIHESQAAQGHTSGAPIAARRAFATAPLPSGPGRGGASPGAPQRLRPEGVKHIIAVASGKGGVGKSTTAVNLAAALSHSCGLRVGILDADVYGPSLPQLLNLHGRPQMVAGPGGKQKMVAMQAYGLTCMSMGFLMDEDVAAVWRGPMVMSAIEQMLWGTQWGPLDVLVVDMPPGTGDAQLTIAQRASLSGAVIVSTPQDLALLDARRGAIMFKKVHVPILGLIENMSYFMCPHCGERSEIFSHGGARTTAKAMDLEFLGEIPLQVKIRELSDAGQPLCVAEPGSAVAEAYSRIAVRLKEHLFGAEGEHQGGRLPEIVME